MTANKIGSDAFLAEAEIVDPGPNGTIIVNESLSTCYMKTVAAEARTLARPTRGGAIFTLQLRTNGGNCTVTVTGNLAGGTPTIVFTAANQFAVLQSFRGADGVGFWRQIASGAN